MCKTVWPRAAAAVVTKLGRTKSHDGCGTGSSIMWRDLRLLMMNN